MVKVEEEVTVKVEEGGEGEQGARSIEGSP
jgi:hypothetical protein